MEAELVSDANASLGECALWHPTDGTLLWTDIYQGRLHRFDPGNGTEKVEHLPGPVGTLALDADGGLVHGAGRVVMHRGRGADTSRLVVELPTGDRSNDGACDPAGRLLIGSFTEELRPGACALYRLEWTDGRWHPRPIVNDVTLSNGVDWSPSGDRLYYVDTVTRRVDVFDYDVATGTASARRCFADLADTAGRPDGICVDAEGGVWVCMVGGGSVRRFDAAGQLSAVCPLPVPGVTSCAFGGRDITDLYVTTARGLRDLPHAPHAGGLFRLRPGVRGRPSTPWAGGPAGAGGA